MDVACNDALDAGAEVDANPSQLFQDDGFVGERSSTAAEFLGYVGEQHPYRARLGPGSGIRVVFIAPTGLVWRERLLDELTNRLAEHA